jgi:succinate dehydrogenase hydrophobic anchor subunit
LSDVRESSIPSRTEAMARVSGLVLAALVVLHVVETSSAIFGREAFLSRSAALVPSWARALVLLPLVGHASSLFRTRELTAGRYPDAGVRKLQRLSGALLLVFLVVHLGHALVPALTTDAAAAYERLRHDLGQPLYLVVYIVGIAATSLHLAQGMEAASSDVVLRFGERPARIVRALGVATAIAVFAVAMNTLSHFAAGRALVLPDTVH